MFTILNGWSCGKGRVLLEHLRIYAEYRGKLLDRQLRDGNHISEVWDLNMLRVDVFDHLMTLKQGPRRTDIAEAMAVMLGEGFMGEVDLYMGLEQASRIGMVEMVEVLLDCGIGTRNWPYHESEYSVKGPRTLDICLMEAVLLAVLNEKTVRRLWAAENRSDNWDAEQRRFLPKPFPEVEPGDPEGMTAVEKAGLGWTRDAADKTVDALVLNGANASAAISLMSVERYRGGGYRAKKSTQDEETAEEKEMVARYLLEKGASLPLTKCICRALHFGWRKGEKCIVHPEGDGFTPRDMVLI